MKEHSHLLNSTIKEIIEDLNENKENQDLNENNKQIQNILNISIITSAKNNNITGVKFLITKGADINATNIIYLNRLILFLINGL